MERDNLLCAAALAAALAFVFFAQSRDDGFRSGHRGWVSSHTLAIAEKSTAAKSFVGYALSLDANGERDLAYFDRYPVFFSVLLHHAGSLARPDKAAQIHVARQVMNAVHTLTAAALVLLLVELGVAFPAAVAAAALASSTSVVVEYRDMVHYDQPALLGMVLLLAAIARCERTGRCGLAVVAAVFAVSCGRGYASLPVLGLWWMAQAFGARRASPRESRLRQLVALPAARALAAGALVAVAAIVWNVAAEARQRGVAWTETSIVDSAARRLDLDAERAAPARRARRTDWPVFVSGQARHLAASALPWTPASPLKRRPVVSMLLALAVVAACSVFVATRSREHRTGALLAVVAGPAWLLAIPNLTAFHPYTAMYLLPTSAALFAALLLRVRGRRQLPFALAACVVFAACTAGREREMSRQARALTLESDDMTAIAAKLRPGERIGLLRPVIRGAPFAVGFYLPDQDLVVEGPTNLLLARGAASRGEDLTPANRYVHLLYSQRPWSARSPIARMHRASFVADKKAQRRRSPR